MFLLLPHKSARPELQLVNNVSGYRYSDLDTVFVTHHKAGLEMSFRFHPVCSSRDAPTTGFDFQPMDIECPPGLAERSERTAIEKSLG